MSTKRTPFASLPLLGLLLLAAPAWGQTQVVAIKDGKIVSVTGRTYAKGTVLIQDGRITAVGARVKIPYKATVIDAAGKVVFPGMIMAHSNQGMDRPNERLPVTPFLDVYDSIDPSSRAYENALRDGVTAMHVIHGNDTVIGGLGRVVYPIGLSVDAMTARATTGLKIAVAGKRGYDRVRQRSILRETFLELKDYLEGVAEKRYEEEEKKAKRDITVPPAKARELGMKLVRERDLDDKHRNLYRLTKGKLDAYVYVERAQDVRFAIKLATDNGFLKRTTWVVGGECYKAVGALKKSGRPVVLPAQLIYRERNPKTGEIDETFVPTVFARARIPFALQTNPYASFAERFLWYQAARCVREGVSLRVALAAITRVPAMILGLGKRMGGIAPGRDGDVLILSGDPLDAETKVEQVLIGGKVVYERAKDWQLRRLISGEKADGDDKKKGDKKGDKKKGDKKSGKQAPGKQAPGKQAPGKKAPGKVKPPAKEPPEKKTPEKKTPKRRRDLGQ